MKLVLNHFSKNLYAYHCNKILLVYASFLRHIEL